MTASPRFADARFAARTTIDGGELRRRLVASGAIVPAEFAAAHEEHHDPAPVLRLDDRGKREAARVAAQSLARPDVLAAAGYIAFQNRLALGLTDDER